MKKTLLTTLLVMATCAADASTMTTQITDLRFSSSSISTANSRVSIKISGTTSCSSNPGWYSYEYPDSGPGAALGKAWTAALLAALSDGASVTIFGTGTCDNFGIEVVSFIDAL